MENSKSILRKGVLFSSALIIFLSSCTKMDHYYKDLKELGDRIDIGKVDSVKAYPGNERLKLTWLTPSDPAASQIIIYWNNYGDSILADVNHSVDTGYFIIEGLDEGAYTFNLVTIDNKGNRSITVEKSSIVVGGTYQQGLITRDIDHAVIFKDSIVIIWNDVFAEDMIGTEVHYFDMDGKPQNTFTPNDALQTNIYNVDTTQEISINSFFIPDSMALDTFKTAYEQLNLSELKLSTLTLEGAGTDNPDFIDFAMVTVYDKDYAKMYPERIDVAHLRGGNSKQNLTAITNDAGFDAFATYLMDEIKSWSVRNDCKMINLGDETANHDLYDGLDENDRVAMKAAFDDAESSESPKGRLTHIATGDIILLYSVDRDIYVAIKATNSEDNGILTIEFKISRF